PSDIPLSDRDVRVKMLNELGVQNAFDAVIEADIEGRNSRARRIDERLASENPSLASIKPATRLATAILLYSFGGLSRKEGSDETLPPGVTENELLEACVSPDIDSLTARAVLSELRNTCLYLHYDGIRYCFKKDPNVTKLIEDAEQQIARQEIEASGRGQVYHKIKQMLEAKLAGQTAAVIWPEKSKDIPDGEPLFLIAYLPPEFAKLTQSEQEKQAKEYFTKYEDRPRRYRNGLGLGIPDKKQIEELQQAVRYLLAIEKVEQAKQQFNLTKEHLEQLKERRRAKETAVESCFRELYTAVWLPSFKDGELGIERVERVGRPLQAVGIHERIMEMLISLGTPRIHEYIVPRKIAERVKLGEGQNLGVEVSAVVESFFRDLTPPRVTSKKILLEAIAKGIGEGTFGYSSSKPAALGEDGKFQISREKVVFGRPIPASEIDLDTGFLIAPSAISTTSQPQVEEAPSRPSDKIEVKVLSTDKPVDVGSSRAESSAKKSSIRLKFKATREQIFKAFPAIANLADNADDGKVMFLIEGFSLAGFDESWLRNAVKEPLEEAEIELLD
ncbi:MAG: ATP-binding protein, partial [Blastocatellia bacterium]|nr:ATP-binding protein [Blastocatellia bacterium]